MTQEKLSKQILQVNTLLYIKFFNLVPKFVIDSKIVSEAVIKTPVQIGVQHETNVTENMNRITGEITKQTVTVDKPILSEMKNLREVTTPVKTIVNINTGAIVPSEDTTPVFHGLSK